MSTSFLILASGLYVLTSIDLALNGQYGMSVAFICYAGANLGLILATRGI